MYDLSLRAICVLFGLLCMYAAAVRLNVPRHRAPCLLMLVGGFALVCAVVADWRGLWWDWLLALGGCAAICIAAIWNGMADGTVHWKHHLIRIILCAWLVYGFLPGYSVADDELSFRYEETQIGQTELADGTAVQLWQVYFDTVSYRLPDGTELLREQTSGPDNVYVAGQESFDDLADTAQQAVLAWYDTRGPLYDVGQALEDAYVSYLAVPDDFDCWPLAQDITPTASNDRLMSFLTVATLPLGGQMVTEQRFGDVFDRETGLHLDTAELFTCSLDEAAEQMLDAAGVSDTAKDEMLSALEPGSIILFPDGIELYFPAGTLPSEQYSSGVFLDLADCPLQDWAVPLDRAE